MSKKHLFLFVIALYSISYTYSQSIENTVDSLFQEISDQGESRRGKYIIKFITPFFSSEPDKGLAHLEVIESKAIASEDTIILITCNALYAEYNWRKSDYKAGIEFGMKAIELAESNERFEEELARGMQTVGTIATTP